MVQDHRIIRPYDDAPSTLDTLEKAGVGATRQHSSRSSNGRSSGGNDFIEINTPLVRAKFHRMGSSVAKRGRSKKRPCITHCGGSP